MHSLAPLPPTRSWYTLRNNGPLGASNVVVSDTLPAGAALVSSSISAGSCTGFSPLTCTAGTLANGASVTLTVTITTPVTAGTLSNTAAVAFSEPDPFLSDNSITTQTSNVSSPADLAISGISPANPRNGAVRTIVISGQNFSSGATVMLSRGARGSPDPGPVFGNVTSGTATSITAEFDLTSSDIVGEWDLQVQNPNTKTAARPLIVVPTLLYSTTELTGTLGFPIGVFRANYLESFSLGNDDGIAMFEIQPPEPGAIQLKVGNLSSPIWSSQTSPDPGKAVIFQPLSIGQSARLKMNWMIPAANILFASRTAPGEAAAAISSGIEADGGPIQVRIGDTRIVVWEGRELIRGKFVDIIKDILLSQTVCTSIGKSLAGVRERDVSAAVDAAVRALNPEGSTAEGLMKKVGETLGGQIPGFDQVKFAADVGSCIGTILQAMEAAYQAEVKKIADNLRRRAQGDIEKAKELALDDIARRQGGLRPIAYKGVIEVQEALAKNPCNKPGVASRNAVTQQVRGPWDPNDKTTKATVPCQRTSTGSQTCLQYFTAPADWIDYTIEFENKAQATAPATDVTVTDVLDSSLDPATLEVLASSSPDTLTTTKSGQSVTFKFTGINLPPNIDPPAGEGFVRFRIRPVLSVAVGTQIHNMASIVFDFNPPLATPDVLYVVSADVDADGVLDLTEDGAPNGGDGNGDGVPDRLQPNVTSVPLSSGNGGYLTVVTGGGCSQNQNVQHVVEASRKQDDPDYGYPAGLLNLTFPCSTAQVTIYHHPLTSLAGATLRRYGPTTPAVASTIGWYDQPSATLGMATAGSATVPTATFSLTDGGIGDDSVADGVILATVGTGTSTSNLAFSSAGFTVNRGRATTATITINRMNRAAGAVGVTYATADGTAIAGTDYTGATGTLTWADGDTSSKTFSVNVAAGATPDVKTVQLILSNPSGGAGLVLPSQSVLSLIGGQKGDANGNGSVGVDDIFYLINTLFAGGPPPVGPADVNGDGQVSVADIFYLINYLFAGGPAPP